MTDVTTIGPDTTIDHVMMIVEGMIIEGMIIVETTTEGMTVGMTIEGMIGGRIVETIDMIVEGGIREETEALLSGEGKMTGKASVTAKDLRYFMLTVSMLSHAIT